MLTFQEYKMRYKNEIEINLLSDEEIIKAYSIYLEDPFDYHPDNVESSVRG